MQCLNTITRECTTIKLLTFAPRCLVAENSWLCCGSETGDFVAICLNEACRSSHDSLAFDLDAEARYRLGGVGEAGDDAAVALLAPNRRSNKSLIAKSMKLAKDRVNCITLWFPSSLRPSSDGAYREPVAVLANNDRTVVLVSLRDFSHNDRIEPLEVVTYPDFVNRAIISPDGSLLVAILDDPYLYVHQRVKSESSNEPACSPSSSPSSSSPASPLPHRSAAAHQWELKQRFLLKSQRKDDRSDSRGSFAACFSASGAHLAVGTQHGSISIFDATLLADPSADPLVTTFKSSRPESGPGAIRDMAFCPGPFDVLAWTEDRGHIGFADVRSNYVVRQIVDINSEDDFDHVDILDRNTIDPRLLDSHGDERGNRLPSTSGASQRRFGDGLETLNQPLTANETLVLEAIQGDRRRRERAAQRSSEEATRGLSDLTWTYLSNLPSASEVYSQRTRERSSSVGRPMGDILSSYREQRERISERARTARQLVRDAAEQRQPIRRPEQRLMDRLGEAVPALRSDSSYLNVLEILQARERSTGEASHDDSSPLVTLVNQASSRWEESAIRGTLAPDHGVFEVPPSPDNTAGLSWTDDGRTL